MLVGSASASATGWAVQAGIIINLPQLAAGDEVYLQGAYAVGARSYLGIDGNPGGLGDRTNAPLRNDVDAVAIANNRAVVAGLPVFDPNGVGAYRLEKGKGWNIQGGLKHYFAPNLKATLWAAYTTWNYGASARALTWDDGGFGNGKEFMVGGQLIWTPVKNLDLTLDLSYQRLTQNVNTEGGNDPLRGQRLTVNAVPGGPAVAVLTPISKNGNAFTGRVRIQRSF